MYFINYRLGKTWLDIRLKSCNSDDTSTDKMANGSKHCCNLNESTFTIFINHCGGNCIGKSLF